MAHPFNLLAAEDGIVGRLKLLTQHGPDAWARMVGTRDYLATVAEEMQHAPAVYLVFDGLVVFDADEQRSSLGLRWLVVVVVSTAAQPAEAAPRNQEAGPLLASVLVGLQGYTPAGCASGLVPATPPRPFYSPGGRFAYYPLAFTARVMHSQRFGLAGAIST